MKTIYYKIITTYCDYPFNQIVDERYCEFYEKTNSKGNKKFKKIDCLKLDSKTTIQEKENYIKEKFKIDKAAIIKLKF